MNASLHVTGTDGVTTGYLARLDAVPRVGEYLYLLGGNGAETKALVSRVVHVLAHTTHGAAGAHQVEVHATQFGG